MRHSIWTYCIRAVLLSAVAAGSPQAPAFGADGATLPVAVAASMTGPGSYYGLPVLDGVRLAVEEAAAEPGSPRIELRLIDDESSVDKARDAARDVCQTDAIAEIGPALTVTALAAGPVYAGCGMLDVPATAHGDDVPKAGTTFQPVFNGGEMGSAMAVYLKHVLKGSRAAVLFRDDGYGRSFADGFERAARALSLPAVMRGFSDDAQRAAAVAATAAEADRPVIALGMLNSDAVPILMALRRQGIDSPVLAPSAIGGEDFVDQFASEPEERRRRGFFTEHVYAASPILFDSANAEILAFADRFRRRYGREPSWPAVQGYDSARLVIEGARRAAGVQGVQARRAAVVAYFASLDGPAQAFAGVTGPIWFTKDRRREQPVRVGLFHDGLFDSAPVQLVPVASPDRQELASGEVIEALPGRYVRRQRVVYTGVFVNEVPRVDLSRSTFTIDFYLWTRFVEDAGPIGFDPSDIRFSGMSGAFNRAGPADQRVMPDGTTYRLWHVEGEVRNEFDLRRFPFDRQDLRLSFFNARADANHVVYVLDRGSLEHGASQSLRRPPAEGGAVAAEAAGGAGGGSVVSPDAFRQLTQWEPVSASERRENLVTVSPLGFPKQLGQERGRELSGYVVDVHVQRRALATASKSLLPLMIMTVIMFASLFFPHGLVKEKVTVAITAALSGAVLLSSVNSQLGAVGYTIAAEYAFYVFFGLSLLCVMTVLVAERLRNAGSKAAALKVEQWAKVVYVVAVAAVVSGAGALASYAAA